MRDHTCTIHGRSYRIPDVWLMGMRQGGFTLSEAVEHWDAQALMEKQHDTPELLTSEEQAYLAELAEAAMEHVAQ